MRVKRAQRELRLPQLTCSSRAMGIVEGCNPKKFDAEYNVFLTTRGAKIRPGTWVTVFVHDDKMDPRDYETLAYVCGIRTNPDSEVASPFEVPQRTSTPPCHAYGCTLTPVAALS